MEPQEKQKIERILELEEENSKILRRMRRTARWSAFLSILYYIVIVGLAVGAFYYIQPFLGKIGQTYGNFSNMYDTVVKSVNHIKR